jgi:hypothetical protein
MVMTWWMGIEAMVGFEDEFEVDMAEEVRMGERKKNRDG